MKTHLEASSENAEFISTEKHVIDRAAYAIVSLSTALEVFPNDPSAPRWRQQIAGLTAQYATGLVVSQGSTQNYNAESD